MIEHETKPLRSGASSADSLARFSATLQPLPSNLRYYDEFNDATRSIRSPAHLNVFELHFHGRCIRVDFAGRAPECALMLKHTLAMMLEQSLSVTTIAAYYSQMHQLTDRDLMVLLETGPLQVARLWSEWRAREQGVAAYILAKHVLHLFCTYRWNGWSDEYRTYLRTALPLPASDKYATVRAGDVFLSAAEEAAIVRHLDDIVGRLRSGEILPHGLIADAGMLLCAYQFAMRPIQIGMLDSRHVRIWHDEVDDDPTVHLTFHMAKQRGNKTRISLTRRVKREWVQIFVQLTLRLRANAAEASDKFFQIKSATEVGRRISSLVRSLIGSDRLGTATDLRHTAAQRLVDAGASHEELAEFMGHAQTNTGLVYYSNSASHAERVNRALGSSEVYRRVAQIAHDRFISP